MEAVIERTNTMISLRKDLINKIADVAKKENCSLDKYIESVLMDIVYNVPNAETRAAIEEARSGAYAGSLDMASYESFVKSINDIE